MGPIRMGISQTAAQKTLQDKLREYANSDRKYYGKGYYKGDQTKFESVGFLVNDILADLEINGYDSKDLLNKATGQIAREFYGELYRELDKRHPDEQQVLKLCRALNRLGVKYKGLVDAITLRRKKQNVPLTDQQKITVKHLAKRLLDNPYDVESVRQAGKGGKAYDTFLSTDEVPDSIFGIPINDNPSKDDLGFFEKYPDAAGFYKNNGEQNND